MQVSEAGLCLTCPRRSTEHRCPAAPTCLMQALGDVGQRIWQQELLNRGSEANRKWRAESCFMKPSPRPAPDDGCVWKREIDVDVHICTED